MARHLNTPVGPGFSNHTVEIKPVIGGFELHHGYVWRNQKFTNVSYFKSRSGVLGRLARVNAMILGA
jgi:hypothetical protein